MICFFYKRKRGIGGIKQFAAIIGKDALPAKNMPTNDTEIADSTPALYDENTKDLEIASQSSLIEAPVLEKSVPRKEESFMLQGQPIKMTRLELYNEIWAISVAGVAKKYSIQYAQLLNQLKEANIPIPPSGYWTKLAFGKPVIKPELSEPFNADVFIFIPNIAPQKANQDSSQRAAKEVGVP